MLRLQAVASIFVCLVIIFGIIIYFTSSNPAFHDVDWCKLSSCGPEPHVACKNYEDFHAACSDPGKVVFTSNQIQLILDNHNKLRDQIAGGKLTRFPSARRMAQVQWDDQLAYLADLNTKQCKMEHDRCRNTPLFDFVGQNLGILSSTHIGSTDEFLLTIMNAWWNEHIDTHIKEIRNYPKFPISGKKIGHFTVMANDHVTTMGCGMSKFKTEDSLDVYLLACNYASTNMLNYPVYQEGSKAKSCIQGPDAKYPALCRISEPINPNDLS